MRKRTDATGSHDTLRPLRQGTYSIVARDPDTGEVGVAVQSHWFSVGSVVSWARPGVGAVATQSIGEPSYGPNLLDLLAQGIAPSEALALPVSGGRLALGTWQGVYLCEHRDHGGSRSLLATLWGE